MASSSFSTLVRITFHHGGLFEANPLKYDFDIVSKLDVVDIHVMDYSAFVTYLETISHAMSNALYFVVPSLDLKDGLRIMEENHHGGIDEDDYDIYNIYSFDEDDTASLDHLFDGEDEITIVRAHTSEPKNKKKILVMFDDTFLAIIFKWLDKDKHVENNVGLGDELNPKDEDRFGELWPIHDPKMKWKFMRPVLGERFEILDQLNGCLTYYALSNGC
ncbi:hypothetical protein Tco_0495790 [Tanacetum coccineum]